MSDGSTVRSRGDEDEKLAAYNDYLAQLAENAKSKKLAPIVNGALLRYRIMATAVGIGLLVLTLIGIPLQYGFGHPAVVEVVGPIHGFLYIIYLLAALDLARRSRFTILQMLTMIAAGFAPFLAFFVEHRITKKVRALMAESQTA